MSCLRAVALAVVGSTGACLGIKVAYSRWVTYASTHAMWLVLGAGTSGVTFRRNYDALLP